MQLLESALPTRRSRVHLSDIGSFRRVPLERARARRGQRHRRRRPGDAVRADAGADRGVRLDPRDAIDGRANSRGAIPPSSSPSLHRLRRTLVAQPGRRIRCRNDRSPVSWLLRWSWGSGCCLGPQLSQPGAGGGDRLPAPSDFVKKIDNPYYPLPVGRTLCLRGREDGVTQVDRVTVTSGQADPGHHARVVSDVARHHGRLLEKTFDWFAQDKKAACGTWVRTRRPTNRTARSIRAGRGRPVWMAPWQGSSCWRTRTFPCLPSGVPQGRGGGHGVGREPRNVPDRSLRRGSMACSRRLRPPGWNRTPTTRSSTRPASASCERGRSRVTRPRGSCA